MPAGRPRQYETVEELEAVIEDYFESCWIDKVTETTDKEGKCTMSTVRYQNRPYTTTGLALHLDLTRQGLLNYQGRPEFFDTIRRAKLKVEMGYEEALFTKVANGAAFGLKENFGWKDSSHHEITGANGGPLKVTRVELVALGDGTD